MTSSISKCCQVDQPPAAELLLSVLPSVDTDKVLAEMADPGQALGPGLPADGAGHVLALENGEDSGCEL